MTRRVVVTRCDCRAEVLKGDCELGIESLADVGGLSVSGLAIATLTNRRVFVLVRSRGVWNLRGITRAELVEALAGRSTSTLLADHECRAPLPGTGDDARALVDPPPVERDPLDVMAESLGLPQPPRPPPF